MQLFINYQTDLSEISHTYKDPQWPRHQFVICHLLPLVQELLTFIK